MNKPTDKHNWSSYHGRKVKEAWIADTSGGACKIYNNIESELVCIVEYMGDRSDVWICKIREGKEITRHNAKYLESIIWED